MSYVAWFKDLNKDSIPVAGGKGANLGEMFNLDLPVPPGFSVTAQTYKEFIETTKIQAFLRTVPLTIWQSLGQYDSFMMEYQDV